MCKTKAIPWNPRHEIETLVKAGDMQLLGCSFIPGEGKVKDLAQTVIDYNTCSHNHDPRCFLPVNNFTHRPRVPNTFKCKGSLVVVCSFGELSSTRPRDNADDGVVRQVPVAFW